jgi:hypothetical protein
MKRNIVCNLVIMAAFGLLFANQNRILASEGTVIPSPKKHLEGAGKVNLSGACIVKRSSSETIDIGIDQIVKAVEKTKSGKLPVKSSINSSSPSIVVSLLNDLEPNEQKMLKDTETEKLGNNGYAIKYKDGKFYLIGKEDCGVAYACLTFAHLVRTGEKGALIPELDILDWPDFKFRCARIIVGGDMSTEEGMKEAKSFVDWCFKYKFNFIYFNYVSSMGKTEDICRKAGKANPFNAINQYAAKRGITIASCLGTGVGGPADKNKPEFKDTTKWKGGCFSWGRDDLIDRQSKANVIKVKRQGWGCVLFHPVDVPSGYWEKRDSATREKFGNDRAKGTAYLLNKYVSGLRKGIGDKLKIVWIIQPYNINLDLKGNEEYHELISRVSKMIPKNILFCPTIISKGGMDSWFKIGRTFFLWKNDPYACEFGIYYSSIIPFIAKTSFRKNREDIFAPLSFPLSSGNSGRYGFNWYPAEPAELAVSEYSWNASLLNQEFVINEKPIDGMQNYRPDTYGVYRRPFLLHNVEKTFTEWVWFDSYKEPSSVAVDFLKKSCVETYGPKGGAVMAQILNKGIMPKVILNAMPKYYKRLYPKVVARWEKEDFLPSQLDKIKSSIKELGEFKRLNGGFKSNTACGKDFCAPFLDQLKTLKIIAEARIASAMAKKDPTKSKADEALKEIQNLKEELSKIKTDYSNWKIKEKFNKEEKSAAALAGANK